MSGRLRDEIFRERDRVERGWLLQEEEEVSGKWEKGLVIFFKTAGEWLVLF